MIENAKGFVKHKKIFLIKSMKKLVKIIGILQNNILYSPNQPEF